MEYKAKRLFDTLNWDKANPHFAKDIPISRIQALFYYSLLPEFTHKNALFVGCKQYGMHQRTIEKSLNLFIELGILERVSRGCYRKIPHASLPESPQANYPFTANSQPAVENKYAFRFSVIIPLYNKAPYIEKSLRSVFDQTFTNFEVIVVDDGSTDNSAQIAEEIIASQHSTFNIQHSQLLRQPNAGVSTARNNGVLASHGEYVCFLDADDWWEPTFLEKMDRLITDYPSAGLYCTNYYYVHNGRNQVKINIPTGYFNYCKEYAKTLCMSATSSSSCISRKIFDEMGGFSPDLKLGEDFDLWIRIALLHGTAICNEPLAYFNNDLPAAHRATHHLHDPQHHMLWNLDYLEFYEQTNPDYKQLIDNLRTYGLQNYYLSKEYHAAALTQLAKVDWSRQPNKYRRFYKMPLYYLRTKRRILEQGVAIKRHLIALKK